MRLARIAYSSAWHPYYSALCPTFLPAWHGLALGELPTVKDAPVPSSMGARSPSRDPSTKPLACKLLLCL
jgi:hypothetical protein